MKPIFVYLVVMRLNDAKTAVIFLDVKRRVQLDFINYPSVKTILDRANVQACVLRISQEYLGESENRMLPIHPCHTADIQYSNRSVYNFIPSHLAQGRLQLYITFFFSLLSFLKFYSNSLNIYSSVHRCFILFYKSSLNTRRLFFK